MSNDASAPQEEQRVSPEYLPLPTLPPVIEYDLAIVITDARVQLYDELNLIWASSFPEQIPTDGGGNLLVRVDPAKFFPPFIAYGVKYYDAYTHALLRLQPRFSDYSAWINFALKTLVCDELVPHRPVGQRHQTLSQWQSHMGLTWRLFDHPNHFDLFPMAQKLIDLLEDVMEPYWDTFHTALHTAISRRTLPALAEGLKQLPPVAPPPDHTVVDPIPETGDAAAKFPIRAQWLADRLQERSWNKHDLYSNGGPTIRLVRKFLMVWQFDRTS